MPDKTKPEFVTNPEPIDLVYTWVDGADSVHREMVANYGITKKQRNPERFRDFFDLLKYSLRSLELYAPWINHVHLVTARPQVPMWLNLDSDRVSIHFHDEIIPADYLPTFSSRTIESYLHMIPHLSEKFIYMNDDFLFGSPIQRSDFFTKNGQMKIYGTLMGETLKMVKDDIFYDLTSKLQHLPRLINKKIYCQMEKDWERKLSVTRSHKFRSRGDVIPHTLYRYFALSQFGDECYAPSLSHYRKLYSFHKIMNDLNEEQKKLWELTKRKPKFICFNDDQKENPNQQVVGLIQEFLESNYSDKSSFEN